jgi:hypothetical protein
MKKLFDQAMGTVSTSAMRVAFSLESRAFIARDAILDKADSFKGSASKVYASAVGTISLASTLGLTVSAIAAPVPTAIGIRLLYLFELQYKQQCRDIDNTVVARWRKREQKRILALLKKHGAIPASALLETEWIKVCINSTGEINGVVIQGPLKDRHLQQLSVEDIQDCIDCAPDDETLEILQAYLAFRDAHTSATQE